MPVITTAGTALIAKHQASNQPLVIDQMAFANVPNLNPSAAINRSLGLPANSLRVHTVQQVTVGYMDTNQVVYSSVLDSSIGDFEFNWLGLYSSAHNTLIAVETVPTQTKRKTSGDKAGNAITRNFLLQFSDAQSITNITVPAATWQLDYSAQVNGLETCIYALATGQAQVQLEQLRQADRIKTITGDY